MLLAALVAGRLVGVLVGLPLGVTGALAAGVIAGVLLLLALLPPLLDGLTVLLLGAGSLLLPPQALRIAMVAINNAVFFIKSPEKFSKGNGIILLD